MAIRIEATGIRLFLAATLLAISTIAHAELQGRAPLTPGGTDYQAYYDTGLDITWLSNANLAASSAFGVTGINSNGSMNWTTAGAWIVAMNAANHLGVSNWRLPRTAPVDGVAYDYDPTFNGSTDTSYNVGGPGTAFAGSTGSEMSHLYYNTLGNRGYCAPSSVGFCTAQTGYGLVNTGPFSNLVAWWYWSGSTYAPDASKAWFFAFDDGSQWGPDKSLNHLYAWAVSPGDLVGPPPANCPTGVTWTDSDGDGAPDLCDNCSGVSNPAQTDSDRDGYGNHCDADLNNNGFVNAQDYVLFRQQLGKPSTPPNYNAADLNSNGFVNAQDYVLFRQRLGVPSGPSGRREPPTALQATPVTGHTKKVPVVVINIIPTLDGVHINSNLWQGRPWGLPAEWGQTLLISDVKNYISDLTSRVKFGLEEGSRFRGYKDAAAQPYLGYQVVATYNIYDEMKPGQGYGGSSIAFLPDLHDILARVPARQLVDVQGVQEFWVNVYEMYGAGEIVFPESNMSSPVTGDISNSHRIADDLPVFSRDYVVYGTNYFRTEAEAIHNHGHQLEVMLSHAASTQDGNYNLFWRDFAGFDTTNPNAWVYVPGRCGAVHWPINARNQYDYYDNPNVVASDCEDWRPDGSGQAKVVGLSTWVNLPYAWPTPGASNVPHSQWLIYWMQNMPGAGNQIPYGGTTMENWWDIIAAWDQSVLSGKGLHR